MAQRKEDEDAGRVIGRIHMKCRNASRPKYVVAPDASDTHDHRSSRGHLVTSERRRRSRREKYDCLEIRDGGRWVVEGDGRLHGRGRRVCF